MILLTAPQSAGVGTRVPALALALELELVLVAVLAHRPLVEVAVPSRLQGKVAMPCQLGVRELRP